MSLTVAMGHWQFLVKIPPNSPPPSRAFIQLSSESSLKRSLKYLILTPVLLDPLYLKPKEDVVYRIINDS